jgi:tetratricopeptide (TPR) repeat protein
VIVNRALNLPAILICTFIFAISAYAQHENQQLAEAQALIQTNPDEAIAKLEALTALHPETKGINHQLGLAYYQKSDFLKAITYLNRAVQEDAEDKDATQLLGLAYYFNGKPAEAIPFLARVRAWYPNTAMDASYILGLCYILTKDYSRAQNVLADLYGVAPDSAAAHLVLAQMLLRQGFDPVAEKEAQKALALSPRLPLAHFVLGELHMYKSEIPDAVSEFVQELATNPGYANAHTRLGDAYSRIGKYEEAEKVLQRSIWLNSTTAEPYVVLGKVLLKKGEPVPAERTLLRAIAIDSNNYSAHYFLGQAYQQTGRVNLAEREMKLGAQIQQRQTEHAPR